MAINSSVKQAATLARIEQKLDDMKETLNGHVEAFAAHEEEDKKEFKAVRTSLASIRYWQSWVIGIGSGVVFLLGVVKVLN